MASAAALAGGFRADTFNAAWHSRAGALLENAQQMPLNSYYVDWDILTFVQIMERLVESGADVNAQG